MSETQEMESRSESRSEMLGIAEPEWFTRLMNSPPGSLSDLFLPSVLGGMVQNSERRKESDRRYRLEHADEIKARRREYYEKNKDRIDEKGREYNQKNKEKIAEYKREYRDRDSTKERQKYHMRAWKEKNKEKQKGYQTKFRRVRAKWFLGIKADLSCSVCGQSFPDYPNVIDFHHRDGSQKEGRISSMVTGNAPEPRILAEIGKCIPVCANCHRKLHADKKKEGQRKAKRSSSDL